jgi:Na+-translocating ferredoxin:NAD+ oxidoreductase RnfD subunit
MLLTLLTVPIYLAAAGRYGYRMFIALAISVLIGYLSEKAGARIRGNSVSCLGYPAWFLFPLVLPPAFPLWMLAATVFFGVVAGVVFFGGHGRQLAAPVAVGWTFASLSYPAAFGFGWAFPFTDTVAGFTRYSAAVPSIDHPIVYLSDRVDVTVTELLAGHFPQTPGNALPILLIACGLLLWILRAVDVRGSFAFLGTVTILSVVFYAIMPEIFPSPKSLLVGNLLFASFFIYSDTRVSPRTKQGRCVTGVLTGITAFIIRALSDFPCGVFYAVLFGNVFSPILDEWMLHAKYGRKKA